MRAFALAPFLALGCALGPSAQAPGTLRVAAANPNADPTVRGAHLVPADPDLDPAFGVEPGGGIRTITEGVRVINMARGAALSATDRLPQAPNDVIPIPSRMGGGFFYLIGTTVWRSDSWLSRAKPVFQTPQTVTRSFVGLDRIYLRMQNGAHVALDPKAGKPIDLGALPATPYLGTFIAVDGWHAVAIADLRGVVSTDDAGVTWRALKIPIEPKELRRSGDVVLVGNANARAPQWFEVQRGGYVTKSAGPETQDKNREEAPDPVQRIFGRRPLLSAIEDGWPLSDGSAIVARDGELARIRLSDGVVLEHTTGAYPQRPSRCHAVSLAVASGFGFVCGEPKGPTAIYAFDQGRLEPLRSFESPRRVIASGNGAIVVHGACDPQANEDDARSPEHLLCVRDRTGEWHDVRMKDPSCVRIGADKSCEEYARNQRIIALASGAVAILSPPEGGRLEGVARLTVLDPGGSARTVPIAIDMTGDTTPSVLRILRTGMWLDGFEERTPNVLSGWVELAGVVLGVQIKLDGHLKHGLLLHDGGTMLASGRWGLGFSGGRRGYETTDGGMSWAPIDLPDPIAQGRANVSRTCGPVGCAIAGWIRVGWGAPVPDEAQTTPVLPSISPVAARPPSLSLTCDLLKQGAPPLPTTFIRTSEDYRYGRTWGGYYPNRPRVTTNWAPFFSVAPPKLGDKDKEVGFSAEARDASNIAGAAARFYAIGPKDGEWDQHNRWVVRWLWPFGSSAEVKSTPLSATPRIVMESSGFLTLATPRQIQWTLHAGDDAQHALLVGRQTYGQSDYAIMELEEGRVPTEVRRADGEPFAEIESSVRAGGRWIVATKETMGTPPATVLWEIDGGIARELARLPRTTDGNGRAGTRLARRADGRAVGVVVDGQPAATRYATAIRWIAPVDLETGAASDPEAVGPIDLADRTLAPCRGDEPGWTLDVPWSPAVRLETATSSTSLRNVLARLRLAPTHACVERLSGTGDIEARAGKVTDAATVEVSVLSGNTRNVLRCAAR